MVLWSGYWRHVRAAGRCRRIFVPRERCGPCRVSHALLPAFVLAWRLDTAEAVGAVIGDVAGGRCGSRPAAERADVPHTTARGWVRRFGTRAPELGVAFAALAAELGGEPVRPPPTLAGSRWWRSPRRSARLLRCRDEPVWACGGSCRRCAAGG